MQLCRARFRYFDLSDAYQFFWRAPGAPVTVGLGASPFVYTNGSPGIQIVTVTGGVVPLLEVNIGSGFIPLIGIAGNYVLFPTQSIRINYVVSAPTVSTIQL